MPTLAGKALVPFEGEFSALTSQASDAAAKIGSGFSKLIPLAAIAAVGAAVGVAVDLGAKYQKTTDLMAAAAGITAAAGARIGQAFLATGGQTIFTAQQMMSALAPVAGTFEFIAGKPLTVAQNLLVMRAAMNLAAASGESLDSATAILAHTMLAFGIPISGVNAASDMLYNTSKRLGVPLDALGTALQRARTAAGAAAPSLGELSSFLLDLAAHGESGRGAVALLNSALTGIEIPTKKVLDAQHKLGLEFLTSKGQLEPLSKIIGEVGPKIEHMGNAQATAFLKSIGFGAASSKLVELMQAGAPAFDAATAAVEKQGTAQADAKLATEGLSGSFDKLKAELINQFTAWGTKLLPVLQTVAQWLAVRLPGAIATVTTAFSAVVTWIESLHGLWAVVGTVMKEINVVVGDVVAWLKMHWAQIAADVDIAWNIISTIIKTYLQVMINIFHVEWNVITTIIGTAITVIIGIVKGIIAIVSFLTGVWKTVTSGVSGFVGGLVGFFTGLPGKIGDALRTIGDAITSPFKIAFNLIGDIWNATLGKLHFTIPGWIPGIGGKTFGLPQMPHWTAGGGYFDKPTIIGVGEGGPEVVLNRPQFQSMMGGAGGAARGGGATQHNVFILNGGDEALLRKVARIVQQNNADLIRGAELNAA